jgi:hypothetical protein
MLSRLNVIVEYDKAHPPISSLLSVKTLALYIPVRLAGG